MSVSEKLKGLMQLAWPAGSVSRPKPAEAGDYCLIGNIVAEHEFGDARELKRGTKHFTPGTKVHCLPAQWGDGYEKVIAIGICRKSRRWITVVMPAKYITNWRGRPVYSPTVLKRLNAGFEGFNVQWRSRQEVEECAAGLVKLDSRS